MIIIINIMKNAARNIEQSWRQHPTKQELYGHLPLITRTIQVRRPRHAWPCWKSKNELINDILLWISSHGRAKRGRPARTYTQQLCADTGCSLEDLPGAMDDRNRWRERVRKILAGNMTWWWWYSYFMVTIISGSSIIVNNIVILLLV